MSVLERACKETATCHASSDPAGTLIVTCLVKLIPRVLTSAPMCPCASKRRRRRRRRRWKSRRRRIVQDSNIRRGEQEEVEGLAGLTPLESSCEYFIYIQNERCSRGEAIRASCARGGRRGGKEAAAWRGRGGSRSRQRCPQEATLEVPATSAKRADARSAGVPAYARISA